MAYKLQTSISIRGMCLCSFLIKETVGCKVPNKQSCVFILATTTLWSRSFLSLREFPNDGCTCHIRGKGITGLRCTHFRHASNFRQTSDRGTIGVNILRKQTSNASVTKMYDFLNTFQKGFSSRHCELHILAISAFSHYIR